VNALVMLAVTMLAALVQAVVPAWAALGQAKLPALAAVVVYYALARHRRDLLWAAILAGLVQDGMGLIPFGYSSFVFCVTGLVMARFKDLVFVQEQVTHMLFGALMAFGSTLFLYGLLYSTALVEMPVSQALHKASGSALLGAVVTPLLFHGCARLDRLMGLVDASESPWQEVP
jgi:rod shape-determining protein MreD